MFVNWENSRIKLLTAQKIKYSENAKPWPVNWPGCVVFNKFIFITSGKAVLSIKDKETNLKRGSCMWIKSGMEYNISRSGSKSLSFYEFDFYLYNSETNNEIRDAGTPDYYFNKGYKSFEFFLITISQLLPINKRQYSFNQFDRVLLEHVLISLLMQYDHEVSIIEKHGDIKRMPGDSMDEVDIANEIITKTPEKINSIKGLAKQVNLHPKQFTRLFKKRFNTTPQKKLIESRLNHVKRLLADTDLTVKQIAMKLGYDNPLFLSTQFHKYFTITPTQFRKTNNNNNNI